MDLQTAANLAEVLGILIVIVGFTFAVVQLMHFRQQRRDTATIELARSFQNPEFAHAIRCITMCPIGLSAEQLKKQGSGYENAAFLVSFTFESVGVMVHRRIVSLDMVWDLMGGTILGAWERLEAWAKDVRAEQGRDKFDEWIEWLVGQLREKEALDEQPAYRKYGDWKP
jgi:hypothetical protein